MLDLNELGEDSWNIGNFTAFYQYLVMQVMPELCTLLKVTLMAHLKLQAMLIDVQQDMPTWLLGVDLPCLRS